MHRTLEVHLHTQLDEPTWQERRRRLPQRPVRGVDPEQRTDVEEVVEIEDCIEVPAAGELEVLTHTRIELIDARAIQLPLLEEGQTRRGRRSGREGPAERRRDHRAADCIGSEYSRPRQTLVCRTCGGAPPRGG